MKKALFFGILILAIALVVFIFKVNTGGDVTAEALSVKADSLQKSDFLKNKQAVLYYSTTADQDFDNKGVSYAIFIDDEGMATGFKMNGLELGTIASNGQSLLLADKNSIKIVGNTYKEFKQNKPQYTGERTGFLKNQNVFFSIYNTGVNKQTGSYDSNVLFGDETSFKRGNIPYYILTSGTTDQSVPILTLDIEKNMYDLREVSFAGDTVEVNDLVQLENKENKEYANLSPIVADADFYYFVLCELIDDTNQDVILFKINKKTRAQEQISVAEHRNNDNLVATIPYSIKNSAYVYGDHFYYIDGLGDVYRLEKGSNRIERKFTIDNPSTDGVRHGEATYFRDDQLFVVRYHENAEELYTIESYSLETGKREKVTTIKNLDNILGSIKGKSLHGYDFRMLK